MKNWFLNIVFIFMIMMGVSCASRAPTLPFERYGSDPYGSWEMINNSSHPIIVIFKNGLTFTLEKGARRKITVKQLIESGCPLEEKRDPNFTNNFRYTGAPNKTKQVFSYRVIVESGARITMTSSQGIIIFINETGGNEIIAIKNAAQTISGSLENNVKIAIVNISSSDAEQSEFVVGELEVLLVNAGKFVVDRRELDRIRREQRFQLSGDVDDNDIVSIGRFAGADVVITGNISGTGSTRRLRLRALDTQNARVLTAASEAY